MCMIVDVWVSFVVVRLLHMVDYPHGSPSLQAFVHLQTLIDVVYVCTHGYRLHITAATLDRAAPQHNNKTHRVRTQLVVLEII